MSRKQPAQTTDAPSPQLRGKGRQGDFVHQTQEMAADDGFRNVSRIWLQKCLTYDQVMRSLEGHKQQIEDFRVPLEAMQPHISDQNELVFVHEGRQYRPTEYALRHIAQHAGASVYDVEVLSGTRPDTNGRERNRPEDREALLKLLRTGFTLLPPNKRYLFRTQTDGTLRAWLSSQYAILDNAWFLEVLADIIPNGRFSHWRDDGDYSTLWGNILIPDSIRAEKDSEYGGMFSIGNSEIGRRRIRATPSLFRAICMNGCIWDQTRGEKFDQKHVGNVDLMALRTRLFRHLNAQIPLIGSAIDSLLSTRSIGWDGATARPVFAALGETARLSAKTNAEIIEAWRGAATEEGQPREVFQTAFAVINAVTRSGRDHKDPATWVQRDELGGHLLGWSKTRWGGLFERAKEMSVDEVDERFATPN